MEDTTFSARVLKYGVMLYGGPDGNNGATSTVWLRFEDSKAFAWLRFYPMGYSLPPNYESESSSGDAIYYVSYRSGDHAKVVDLLRNEEPIRFYWDDESEIAYLRSGAEDVGEGEDD